MDVGAGPQIKEKYAYDAAGRLQPFSPPNGVLGADVVADAAEQSEIIIRQTTVELERMVREMKAREAAEGGARDEQGEDDEERHAEEGLGGEEGDAKVAFIRSKGLTSAEAALLMAKYGRNELQEKHTPKWLIFLQQLYQPMPIMIWIAAVVEGAIENFPDMGILLGIQMLNASLSYYETTKAADAVAALKVMIVVVVVIVLVVTAATISAAKYSCEDKHQGSNTTIESISKRRG